MDRQVQEAKDKGIAEGIEAEKATFAESEKKRIAEEKRLAKLKAEKEHKEEVAKEMAKIKESQQLSDDLK